ncbi:MAG: translation initiation factor IF-2 subunit gamma [Conexivisphaerales archaeon]
MNTYPAILSGTKSTKRIPKQPEANVGTVGHVDHGKTTITEALTGKWTSAHSEELRRGITIKVGYADAAVYKCTGCQPPMCYNTDGECSECGGEAQLQRVISIVDSPGHESLMANMLSGAAIMDGALVVIAANEPVPQPQTKEHLQALKMIGVDKLVAVQNKVDLVTYQQARENADRIAAFLESYGFKDIPIIPVSAQRRLNIDALIMAIEQYIPTPKRDPNAQPLMYVLRSFDVNLPGSKIEELKGGVVGGTLLRGTLKVGDDIEIRPGIYDSAKGRYLPVTTKISSLGTSAGFVDKVHPGGLIAIGTLLDPYYTKSDSLAGNVVGLPGTLPPELETLTFEADLFDVVLGATENTKVEPIKMGEILRLNVGTATTAGSVVQLKGKKVTVKLRKPVCSEPNARIAISRRIADRWRLIGSGLLSG